MEHRRENVDDEPLFSESRPLHKMGGSLYVGLMSEFRKMNDLNDGEDVTVETYENRYVIRKQSED